MADPVVLAAELLSGYVALHYVYWAERDFPKPAFDPAMIADSALVEWFQDQPGTRVEHLRLRGMAIAMAEDAHTDWEGTA